MRAEMEDLGGILKRLGQRTISNDTVHPETEIQEDELLGDVDCTICAGVGWVSYKVAVGDPKFGKAEPCSCRVELSSSDTLQLLRYSNLKALQRIRFDSLHEEGPSNKSELQQLYHRAYSRCLEFSSEPQGWLVITGGVGFGKTHLAAAIVNEAIMSGTPAVYMPVPDLFDNLRGAATAYNELLGDGFFAQIRESKLLVLDDLGVMGSTAWAREKLLQLLNHRFNALLPTVIVLSGQPERLDPSLRDRIGDSRITEMLNLDVNSGSPIADLGLPEAQLLQRMSFDSFDTRGNRGRTLSQGQLTGLQYAYDVARTFADAPEGWLVLLGDTGVGKTHLAVAIVRERLEAGESVAFAFVPALLDHLRFTFTPDSTVNYDQLFEWIRQVPLLVLDDLGAQRTSPWAEEKLYQLIVHRHNARLATVITTRGLSGDNNDPISSRLKDPSLVSVLAIDVPDYRDQEIQRRSPRNVEKPAYGRNRRASG